MSIYKLIKYDKQGILCARLEILKRMFVFLIILIKILFKSVSVYGEEIVGYKYTLDDFDSVEEFQKSYTEYIDRCLDLSGGGMGGFNCLIESKIWGNELDVQYDKISSMLNDADKKYFKDAQDKWVLMKDVNVEMEKQLIKGDDGTMYALMRASMLDKLTADIVKQRVLYLKKLKDLLRNK